MAAPMKTTLSTLFGFGNRTVIALFKRHVKYDQSYIAPTKTLEQLNAPIAPEDERRFKNIKAAAIDDNTFTDYDPLLQKFINMMMRSGEKQITREIVRKAFETIKYIQLEKYHKESDDEKKREIVIDPYVIFQQAVENGKPVLITTKVLKSGQKLSVPVACSEERATFLSMKWLIMAARDKKKNERIWDKLGTEIINAYNFQGGLIRRKQEMHKICEANKAFAHLAYR